MTAQMDDRLGLCDSFFSGVRPRTLLVAPATTPAPQPAQAYALAIALTYPCFALRSIYLRIHEKQWGKSKSLTPGE
jgi:hypothetical protein